MAIPTVVAVGTVANGVGDITPGLPAGTAQDDILLAFIECTASDTINVPAGWAHVTGSPVTGGLATATQLGVLWKRAGSSESAPTFTDAGNHQVGRILGVRGCITSGNPWDVTETGTAAGSASISIPGDTTTVADCLVVVAVASGRDIDTTTGISGWTNAGLSSLTEQIDNWVSDGDGGGIGVATGGKATAGSYAATTATLGAAAGTQAMMSLALKPPAGGGTAHTQTVDDAIAGTDAAAKAPVLAKADAGSLADAQAKAPILAVADAAAITDSQSTVAAFVRPIADSASLTDAAAKSVTTAVADSASLADAPAKRPGVVCADSLAITDALSRTMGQAIADALSITDASTRSLNGGAVRPWTYGGTATFTYNHTEDWTYTHDETWTYEPVTG